jgi:hypothetical protein
LTPLDGAEAGPDMFDGTHVWVTDEDDGSLTEIWSH